MNKIIKVVLIIFAAVVLLLGLSAVYIRIKLPDVALIDINIESTPARIERGRYLAEHVAVCLDCHSGRDWNRFSGPMISGTEGMGGEKFTPEMSLPGIFIAPNITPSALSSWSDAEIYRAVTSGVSRSGRPLFSIMPWPAYAAMDREDIFSIIAFIRSLDAIDSVQSLSAPAFPVNILMRTFPKPANHSKMPAADAPSAEHGKYLALAASCVDCHSPVKNGQVISGQENAGGREFVMPSGIVRSANITPDETGLKQWTKEIFIARFKFYTNEKNAVITGGKGFNSPMPWTMYAGMTAEDLGKIYDYLHSLEPIAKMVNKFSPAEVN